MSPSEPWHIIAIFPQGRRHGLEQRSFCPSVFSWRREKWNVTPIIWAVDSVRKTGCSSGKLQPDPQLLNEAEQVFMLLAPHSAVTLHTRDPSTRGVWLQHPEALSLPWGWTRALGPQSAFSFKAQRHFGGIQDQSPWRRWIPVSAADSWTVMPGCTKSCALLQCCFGGGRKKCNSVHQECLNKRGTLANYFSAKLGLAKSANWMWNIILFYQEIKSLGGKKIPVFRSDQVVLIQMFYIQIIHFSGAWKKLALWYSQLIFTVFSRCANFSYDSRTFC